MSCSCFGGSSGFKPYPSGKLSPEEKEMKKKYEKALKDWIRLDEDTIYAYGDSTTLRMHNYLLEEAKKEKEKCLKALWMLYVLRKRQEVKDKKKAEAEASSSSLPVQKTESAPKTKSAQKTQTTQKYKTTTKPTAPSSSGIPKAETPSAPIQQEEENCAVCLDVLVSGQFRATVCGHKFHKSCFKEMTLINDTCPICRTKIC